MQKMFKCLLIGITGFLLFTGCARNIQKVVLPTLHDGRYDSEFPYKSTSKELHRVAESVRKLTAVAYYKGYEFEYDTAPTLKQIQKNQYRHKVKNEKYYSNSVIGTATILKYSNTEVVVLTCAHVVDFADTMLTYYSNDDGSRTNFIQSVSFRKRQSNFIADFPDKGDLEVLALNSKLDIAILGKHLTGTTPRMFPTVEYPLGFGKDLEWGSFVYVVGYPKGYQMITKGIVSQPNRDKKGGFLIDALFNQGFSGGIVLAIRDGVPNFEVVGMATSVAAEFENVVVPQFEADFGKYDPRIPYTGKTYVKFKKNINYGITFVVSTEEIANFIWLNRAGLLDKGYDLSNLIKKHKKHFPDFEE